MVNSASVIKEIKNYADIENVPIINDKSLDHIKYLIKKQGIKNILEIGTAIGYSAIEMALVDDDINITTIERDEKRYLEAIKNIKKLNLEKRINLIYSDALNVKLEDKFDMIFIDAAKAQNVKFFEKFEKNLKDRGIIITDNIKFHGLVDSQDIKSKNLKALVRKIRDYISYLKENNNYETEFIDIGDGLAISYKK